MPPIKELNFFNQLVFQESSAYSGVWRRPTALKRLHEATKNSQIAQNWLNLLFHLCQKNIDVTWYSKIFERCPQHKIAGEITPEYMLLPLEGIEAIKALNPDIKIIMILRHPIDRIESHLRMVTNNCPYISDSLLSSIAQSKSLLNRSDYQPLIDKWLKVFDRHQIFIGNYNDLRDYPESFMNTLGIFLGKKFDTSVGSFSKKIHQSDKRIRNCQLEFQQFSQKESLEKKWQAIKFDKISLIADE